MDELREHGYYRVFWDNNRIGENPLKLYNIIGVPMHHMHPYVTPLWFIRDLMVVMILAPIVYVFVKYCKIYGLTFVAVLMILNIWIPIEGFSASAFFFFSLGAYFQINEKNFIIEFRKIATVAYVLAPIFLILSVCFYGHGYHVSSILAKAFTVFGVISLVNIAGLLVEKDRVCIYPILAASSFFIYASHTILIQGISTKISRYILPFNNEFSVITSYFLQATITVVICVILFSLMRKCCPKLLSVLTGGR